MRRTAVQVCNEDLFLIGDQAFRAYVHPANGIYLPFLYLDAVTNYDVYGAMMNLSQGNYFAGTDAVDAYYADQSGWRSNAFAQGCHYVPSVIPGFNDRGVRLNASHAPLSRQLTENLDHGTLFSYSLTKAVPLIDPLIQNLLLVNSFNEWHEDTQIEPCNGGSSNLPSGLTEGLDYAAYGELYLDLLREATLGMHNGTNAVSEKVTIFGGRQRS